MLCLSVGEKMASCCLRHGRQFKLKSCEVPRLPVTWVQVLNGMGAWRYREMTSMKMDSSAYRQKHNSPAPNKLKR